MVKESKPRKSKNVPSDEQLQSEIRALLIDADFSKVTFTDVITQLGKPCALGSYTCNFLSMPYMRC
jgi:hypothetical protein